MLTWRTAPRRLGFRSSVESPRHLGDFSGDLLDGVLARATRDLGSEAGAVAHHVRVADIGPDRQDDLLAASQLLGHQPVQLVLRPTLAEEGGREDQLPWLASFRK